MVARGAPQTTNLNDSRFIHSPPAMPELPPPADRHRVSSPDGSPSPVRQPDEAADSITRLNSVPGHLGVIILHGDSEPRGACLTPGSPRLRSPLNESGAGLARVAGPHAAGYHRALSRGLEPEAINRITSTSTVKPPTSQAGSNSFARNWARNRNTPACRPR